MPSAALGPSGHVLGPTNGGHSDLGALRPCAPAARPFHESRRCWVRRMLSQFREGQSTCHLRPDLGGMSIPSTRYSQPLSRSGPRGPGIRPGREGPAVRPGPPDPSARPGPRDPSARCRPSAGQSVCSLRALVTVRCLRAGRGGRATEGGNRLLTQLVGVSRTSSCSPGRFSLWFRPSAATTRRRVGRRRRCSRLGAVAGFPCRLRQPAGHSPWSISAAGAGRRHSNDSTRS